MSLGRKDKEGNQGSNHKYKFTHLQLLQSIADSVSGGGGGGGATEATLLSVLNAIVASDQDVEILLVRDTGDSDVVIQQITNYETGTPTVEYKKVDGSTHVVIGPLVYLDPTATQNLILTEMLDQGTTLDSIEIINTAINAALDTIKTDTVLLTPGSITPVTVVTAAAGNVPAGALRGSMMNVGDNPGTWNGALIPAGVGVPFSGVGHRDTHVQINFDPTTSGGTTFIIEYSIVTP